MEKVDDAVETRKLERNGKGRDGGDPVTGKGGRSSKLGGAVHLHLHGAMSESPQRGPTEGQRLPPRNLHHGVHL